MGNLPLVKKISKMGFVWRKLMICQEKSKIALTGGICISQKLRAKNCTEMPENISGFSLPYARDGVRR